MPAFLFAEVKALSVFERLPLAKERLQLRPAALELQGEEFDVGEVDTANVFAPPFRVDRVVEVKVVIVVEEATACGAEFFVDEHGGGVDRDIIEKDDVVTSNADLAGHLSLFVVWEDGLLCIRSIKRCADFEQGLEEELALFWSIFLQHLPEATSCGLCRQFAESGF